MTTRRRRTGIVRALAQGIASISLMPRRQAPVFEYVPRSAREALARDSRALAGDWQRVGADLAAALERFEREYGLTPEGREARGAPDRP